MQIYLITLKTAQFWKELVPLIASLTAILIAIWGDALKKKFIKPSLIFQEIDTLIQKQEKSGTVKGYYYMYRILVKNKNSFSVAPAEQVRASIVFANKNLPLPIPLTWTHLNIDSRDISKGESAYLDVIIGHTYPDYIHKFYSKIEGVIALPEYALENVNKTKIKIAFFEKNSELQSVELEFNPVEKKLKIL